eukprot:5562932-Prymnesium_polylepis.1
MALLAEARRPRRRATEHGTDEIPPVFSMIQLPGHRRVPLLERIRVVSRLRGDPPLPCGVVEWAVARGAARWIAQDRGPVALESVAKRVDETNGGVSPAVRRRAAARAEAG